MVDKPFLYPQVNPASIRNTDLKEPVQNKKIQGVPSEFDESLNQAIESSSLKAPLKFSSHATQRLNERKIQLSAETMAKVNEAIDKASSKGVEDTLVLTSDAALIVNVKNRTVITAMDRGQLNGNVFTNIDGAVIVS